MENTTLQEGDRCVWYKLHGTLCFLRGVQTLRDNFGDDKFLIKPANIIQFYAIMQVVASAAGLVAEMGVEDEKIFSYNFVKPKPEEDQEKHAVVQATA